MQSTSAVYHLTSPDFRKSLVPLHHNHRVIYLREASLRVGDLTLAQFGDKHRKLARWVFPLWLYVAVTGPVCYWMLKPYY